MYEPDGFEVWLEESVERLEWGTVVSGTVDIPQTCLPLGVVEVARGI